MQRMNDATGIEYDDETRTATVTFADDDVDVVNVLAFCVNASDGSVETIRIYARQRLAAEYQRSNGGFDLVARHTLQ
ncbi:hypothetical protein [Bradyrhizobium sp. BRP23]|uniref:hypothetical protein n=1 Tax=Bradyrhizobium sp. BRP23 TaxID=2793820 RepID=UPI001CD4A78F|nr:hypothetical protein [Bradyrhizobium sp. BRP23]MCA1419463.1 hypothetical protein [Bradyrhizobium sp. BRP23]